MGYTLAFLRDTLFAACARIAGLTVLSTIRFSIPGFTIIAITTPRTVPTVLGTRTLGFISVALAVTALRRGRRCVVVVICDVIVVVRDVIVIAVAAAVTGAPRILAVEETVLIVVGTVSAFTSIVPFVQCVVIVTVRVIIPRWIRRWTADERENESEEQKKGRQPSVMTCCSSHVHTPPVGLDSEATVLPHTDL